MTDAAANRTTIIARAVLIIAALGFAAGLVRLGAYAALALNYPYGMDYGEGVVWQQMIRIVAGSGYAPLGELPAFVFQYPPLYHLTTAGVAALFGMDQLYAGRLVSLLSTIVAAVAIGFIAAAAIGGGEDRRVRALAGIMAALFYVTLPLLLTSALLMQIDMLAMALTLGAMLLAIRAVERPGAAVWAGVLFAAALYTRQTSLSAPAAAFLVLLAVRTRAAWTMVGTAVAGCVAALGLLYLTGSDQFLVQILTYNMNRIAWDHAPKLAFVLMANIVPIALGAIGAAVAWRRLAPGNWRDLRDRLRRESGLVAVGMVLVALAIKTVMVPMILKSGANDNYLVDWFAWLAVLIGVALVSVARAALRRPAAPGLVLLALVAVGLPLQMIEPPLFPDTARADRERIAQAELVARIRASAKPVVSDNMVAVLRAGRPVIWEPAIIAELGAAGTYDEQALAKRIRRGEFGFFATQGDRGDLMYDQRFNPVIADAIDTAYPRREQLGDVTLHLPR